MLSWIRRVIRQYFGFSRGQTYGVMILLPLLALALAVPSIIHIYTTSQDKKYIVENQEQLEFIFKRLQEKNTKHKQLNDKSKELFDINKATEEELKKIYGIGPVRAKRIIAYRKALGGFILPSQYNEVYNLPYDVVSNLKKHTFIEENFLPNKINLNTSSLTTLSSHPYLNYPQAKAIIRYRTSQGRFNHVKELKKIKGISDKNFKKIHPYLTCN